MIKFSYNLDPAGNVAFQKDENRAIDVNVNSEICENPAIIGANGERNN